MVKAETSRIFAGREVTQNDTGSGSEQWVKRDPKRGVRREGIRPAGDLLVDNFETSWLFSRKQNRLVERLSLLKKGPRRPAQDFARQIERGELRAEWIGSDVVAGHTTDIVSVAPPPGVEATSRRFWIDKKTGLRLKTVEMGAQGRILSQTYFLTIDLAPVFRPDDFAKPTLGPGVRFERDIRESFPTVEAAQKKAGFALRRARVLPTGFTLRGVSLSTLRASGTLVTQRYTNGLNAFTLFQTNAALPEHWGKKNKNNGTPADDSDVVPLPGGRRAYTWRDRGFSFALIGSLSPDEIRRIARSVR